jgi:DNA invertase Pin-like site-specific DNA recombinase
MQDAEAGKFDVVIVDKVDRFYRHLAGLLTALDELRGYNVSFVSVQERLDFTSPWGKLMLTVLGILAEIYLDNPPPGNDQRKTSTRQRRAVEWLCSFRVLPRVMR